MGCEYAYYKEEETYYPRLYCRLNNHYCIYSKKCLKQERFIPTDNQGECYIMNMEKRKKIPKGSYYVRFEHKGNLFVEIDDSHVVQIKNTLSGVTDYVYVKKVDNNYEISLSPFPTENTLKEETPKKEKTDVRTTTKKKKKNNSYVKNES